MKNLKQLTAKLMFILAIFAGSFSANAQETIQNNIGPANNPYLMQESVYPSIHWNSASTDVTDIKGWEKSAKIESEDYEWLPSVTSVGAAHRVYENGESALIVSGTSRISKIRITDGTFHLVDEIIVPGYEKESISTTKIRELVKEMEASGTDEERFLAAAQEYTETIGQESARIGDGVYTVLDKDGAYFCGFKTSVYKVEDVDPTDVYSPLRISRAFDVRSPFEPEVASTISRLMGINLTYDGRIVIAMPGIIAVMDRDFNDFQYVLLKGEAIDNGVTVDPDGGIYAVTSKYMRKMVWTGTTLSNEESDGAWKTAYDIVPNPRSLSRGAGNTPTLMGFGPDEDKLVILADAGDPVKIVAFWRDEIPEDFKQKPGTISRRIADQKELTIDVPATIEWSPHVSGNGVMMFASAWPEPINYENGKLDIFSTVLTAGLTRPAPQGSEKWEWNSQTHEFETKWTTDYPLQWAIYPVSSNSNTVTLTTFKDGVYGLVTVNWDTGEEISYVELGKSPIFNTAGGFFIPLDDNSFYLTGILGHVRVWHPDVVR